jgi:hypothetical protein
MFADGTEDNFRRPRSKAARPQHSESPVDGVAKCLTDRMIIVVRYMALALLLNDLFGRVATKNRLLDQKPGTHAIDSTAVLGHWDAGRAHVASRRGKDAAVTAV